MVVSLLIVVVSVVISACLLLCVDGGGVNGVIQSVKIINQIKINVVVVLYYEIDVTINNKI